MAPSRALLSTSQLCIRGIRHQLPIQRRFATASALHAEESRLPRVASPSLWQSIIPKAFRRSERLKTGVDDQKPTKKKDWNPFTIYIVLALLVGSNAIQIIALRNETLNFSRKTDAKLALLREVVQRVKNGEDVDVEGLLGTGDPQQEKEWEEVIQELENSDMIEEGRKKREAKHAEKMEKRRQIDEERKLAKEREGSSRRLESDSSSSKPRGPQWMT